MALKNRISRQQLKEQFGEENIFRFYFGEFQLGKVYNSVFRKDLKRSTGFYISEHGNIIYNDLATGHKYDFVKFVQSKFALTYGQALAKIFADLSTFKGVLKPLNNISHTPHTEKPTKVFKVVTKPFTKADLRYWQQYSITPQELQQNNVYSVYSVQIGDYLIHTLTGELKFAYLFKDQEGNGYFKIYSPYSEMWKWAGNTNLHLPFGLDSLQCTGDTLIVTKSVKDCLVLRKFFPECIGLQNEGSSALKKDTIKVLKKCYKKFIIIFDLDRPGILAANFYKKTYGFKPYFIGNPKLTLWQNIINAKQRNVKDASDFVKCYGIDVLSQYLKQLKLI